MLLAITRAFAFRPKQIPYKDWTILRGDKAVLISGKEKGKEGIVKKVIRKKNMVIITGLNMKIKHQRASANDPEAKRLQIEAPIHVSNVALIDPETSKPAKVKRGYLEDGTRVRISKKTGAMIPKPVFPELSYAERHKNKQDGVKDTAPDVAILKTYKGEDFEKIRKEFAEYITKREKEAAWLVFPE